MVCAGEARISKRRLAGNASSRTGDGIARVDERRSDACEKIGYAANISGLVVVEKIANYFNVSSGGA